MRACAKVTTFVAGKVLKVHQGPAARLIYRGEARVRVALSSGSAPGSKAAMCAGCQPLSKKGIARASRLGLRFNSVL
jgi:hypothetical protein